MKYSLILLRLFALIITGHFTCLFARAQQVQWTVVTPAANSITGNENLFIQLLINDTYSYQEGSVQVLLDGNSITALMRINGHKLNIIYEGTLTDGKHHIEVKANITPVGRVESTGWSFFVNRQNSDTSKNTQHPKNRWAYSGFLTAENRNEAISGSGQALRQEPSFTRTVTLDMAGRYKDITIPVKLYVTSDKRFTLQTPDYYSVGFRRKWLEADFGDLNPAIDRLILTGVRLRGAKVQIKYRNTSLQLFYGYMNQSYEGRLERYAPGLGVIPSNLANDTQYIILGTYKRWMAALRFEMGNNKGTYKIGFNVLKAKDDTGSVKYGLEPKDNLAASIDIMTKFFKKTLTIQTGVGASVLTKDTKYGAASNEYLDSALHIKVGFNPAGYDNFIVINSSTVPFSAKGAQYLAYYAQAIHSYKIQYLSVEYRRNGGGFFSLGNPFLRNNYNGLTINERISLLQRKIHLAANFQKYSNNVNEGSALTNRTTIIGSNAFVSIDNKYPSLFLSYMNQSRVTDNALLRQDTISSRKYTFGNFTASAGYSFNTGNFRHDLRATYNTNISNDLSRPENKILFNNFSFGVSETFFKKYSISADIGKTNLKNAGGEKYSDIFSYSVFTQYSLDSKKAYVSFGVSDNKNNATLFANQSTRMSVIIRGAYKFYKGMGLLVEAGTQPYREAGSGLNNFDEKYIYLKYTYDFNFK